MDLQDTKNEQSSSALQQSTLQKLSQIWIILEQILFGLLMTLQTNILQQNNCLNKTENAVHFHDHKSHQTLLWDILYYNILYRQHVYAVLCCCLNVYLIIICLQGKPGEPGKPGKDPRVSFDSVFSSSQVLLSQVTLCWCDTNSEICGLILQLLQGLKVKKKYIYIKISTFPECWKSSVVNMWPHMLMTKFLASHRKHALSSTTIALFDILLPGRARFTRTEGEFLFFLCANNCIW